jgi:hypothetical protein
MDRFSWLARPVLCIALLSVPTLAAQQGTPPSSPAMTVGETLDVQLFNVTPTSQVTIAFQGLRFITPPHPKAGSEAAVAGVSLQGNTLIFSPPQRSVPVGQFSTVSFSVGILADGPITGTATVHKPIVLVLSTLHGSAATQDGTFSIPISRPMPAGVTPPSQ